MSKRAEEAANKYIGHSFEPDEDSAITLARSGYYQGYEQAEKDTIERACKWVKLHTCTFNNMEEVDLYVDLFRKAMEEE